MEVTASKMFSVVVAVIVLTKSSYAGYIYPRPNIAFELPKNTPHFREELEKKSINENSVFKTHESVVSYSVPFQDFNYLHQLKTGHQESAKIVANAHTSHIAVNNPTIQIQSPVNNLASSAPIVNIPGNVPKVNIPVRPSPRSNLLTATPSLNIPTSINYHNSFTDNLLNHNNIPVVNIGTEPVPATIQQESHLLVNHDPHINVPNENIKTISIPTPITQQIIDTTTTQQIIPSHLAINTDNNIPALNLRSPIEHLTVPPLNIPIANSPVLIHQHGDLELNTELQFVNHEVNDVLNGPVNIRNVVTPKITKHIYFHAPPPEIEEPIVHTFTPKKTIYKIIFIKVPSQTTKNNIQLQGNANNFVAPIEEKTIIYVLSKKPEPQPLLLPKPIPSEHEVLFVKYSGNPAIAEDIEASEQPGSELLLTSRLQPGLINGKR